MTRTESWDLKYNALKDFYNENGHLNIKDWKGRFLNGIDLYQWMKDLRQKKRKGLLTDKQLEELDSINFPWKTARTMSWDEKYAIAKKYYEEHGTVDVYINVTLEDGYGLGAWVYAQRLAYRENKLTERQVQLLNELGFDKFVNDKQDEKWDRNLEIARRYYAEYETINVEDGLIYEDFNLGNWIANAMNFYHRGILPKSRIKQLEEMGIHWTRIGNEEFVWERYYFQLKNFLKNHSIEELSTTGDMNGVYNWLDKQKKLIKEDNLEEDKYNKLLELGISLERKTKFDAHWDKFYALAKEYYEKNGHLLMSKNYKTENGESLGHFIQCKRSAYNGIGKWKITQEEIDLLNQIGMEWRGVIEGWWDYKLKILKEYLQITETPFPMSRSLIYKKIELGKFLYDTQVKVRDNKLTEQQLQDILAIVPEIRTIKLLTDKQARRINNESSKKGEI